MIGSDFSNASRLNLDVPAKEQCLSVNNLPAQKTCLAEEVEIANAGNISLSSPISHSKDITLTHSAFIQRVQSH